MNDPKLSIRNLIKNNWDASNTSDIIPTVSTGWFDTKNKTPQITVTNPTEVVFGGGPSGYTGMGSTPSQYWDGSVNVDLWVTREDAGIKDAVNPKKFLFQMKKEVKRIIKAKYQDISDLQFIVWRGGNEMVDTSMSPVAYRFAGEVGYFVLD